jgi:hypothetical protein
MSTFYDGANDMNLRIDEITEWLRDMCYALGTDDEAWFIDQFVAAEF